MAKFASIAAGLVAASMLPPLAAQEPPSIAKPRPRTEEAALALKIRKRVEELQSLRRDRAREEARHADDLAALRRQIERLQGELEPVETSAKKEEEELAALNQTAAQAARLASDAQSWINLVADAARPVARRASQTMRTSASDDAPRRQAEFDQAAAWLDDRDPPQRVKGVQAVCRLFGEEWTSARAVELENAPVLLENGSQMHQAWVIRFGNVAKVFVAEDGRAAGVWSHDAANPWRLDLPESTRRQLDDLVAIVREQRPPAVVPVPVFRNVTPTDTQ